MGAGVGSLVGSTSSFLLSFRLGYFHWALCSYLAPTWLLLGSYLAPTWLLLGSHILHIFNHLIELIQFTQDPPI
jgi:hypothetical protein